MTLDTARPTWWVVLILVCTVTGCAVPLQMDHFKPLPDANWKTTSLNEASYEYEDSKIIVRGDIFGKRSGDNVIRPKPRPPATVVDGGVRIWVEFYGVNGKPQWHAMRIRNHEARKVRLSNIEVFDQRSKRFEPLVAGSLAGLFYRLRLDFPTDVVQELRLEFSPAFDGLGVGKVPPLTFRREISDTSTIW